MKTGKKGSRLNTNYTVLSGAPWRWIQIVLTQIISNMETKRNIVEIFPQVVHLTVMWRSS